VSKVFIVARPPSPLSCNHHSWLCQAESMGGPVTELRGIGTTIGGTCPLTAFAATSDIRAPAAIRSYGLRSEGQQPQSPNISLERSRRFDARSNGVEAGDVLNASACDLTAPFPRKSGQTLRSRTTDLFDRKHDRCHSTLDFARSNPCQTLSLCRTFLTEE
jgi:hypothetical protein